MDNKAKPILFSTPMVQAIMDGRKTMTRWVIKIDDAPENWQISIAGTSIVRTAPYDVKLARYKIGVILWVRETWNGMCIDCGECAGDNVGYQYKADSRRPSGCAYEQSWRPPIFMPKEACRLFLRVTGVRAERLQEITEADANREGCTKDPGSPPEHPSGEWSACENFQELWDSLYAKRGYGWETNPWVWVYTFERCDKPEGWCK